MNCPPDLKVKSNPLQIFVQDYEAPRIDDPLRVYGYPGFPPINSESYEVQVSETVGYTITIELTDPPDRDPSTPIHDVLVGEPLTFEGDFYDSLGNPVVGGDVVVAEKDAFGRWVPMKDSAGNEIHVKTDWHGHYKLVDDDGWPTGGKKVVWALGCPPPNHFDSWWQDCRE